MKVGHRSALNLNQSGSAACRCAPRISSACPAASDTLAALMQSNNVAFAPTYGDGNLGAVLPVYLPERCFSPDRDTMTAPRRGPGAQPFQAILWQQMLRISLERHSSTSCRAYIVVRDRLAGRTSGSDYTGNCKHDQDDQQCAQSAAGEVAPMDTMRPERQCPDKHKNNKNNES